MTDHLYWLMQLDLQYTLMEWYGIGSPSDRWDDFVWIDTIIYHFCNFEIKEYNMKLDNHFKISIVKSWIRIAAGMMIINFGIDNSFQILCWAGLLLIVAELLGIAEEIF